MISLEAAWNAREEGAAEISLFFLCPAPDVRQGCSFSEGRFGLPYYMRVGKWDLPEKLLPVSQ